MTVIRINYFFLPSILFKTGIGAEVHKSIDLQAPVRLMKPHVLLWQTSPDPTQLRNCHLQTSLTILVVY